MRLITIWCRPDCPHTHSHFLVYSFLFLALCLFSYFCMRHNVHFSLLPLSLSPSSFGLLGRSRIEQHMQQYIQMRLTSSFFSFLPPLNNNHINKSTHIYIYIQRERGRMSPNHITIDCVNEFDYPIDAFSIITTWCST